MRTTHALHPRHPRPRVAEAIEAIEGGHRREAPKDQSQRAIWLGFYASLGLLLAVELAAGLLHRSSVGNEALPPPPAAP